MSKPKCPKCPKGCKLIPLTQGKYAIVDKEDYNRIIQHEWHAVKDNNVYYAQTNAYIEGKRTSIRMHRIIFNAIKGSIVDHKDRDGLNNSKYNLRISNIQQNRLNSKINANNSSGYKGVSKDRNSWRATAVLNNKYISIGSFKSKESAAHARDAFYQFYNPEFTVFNRDLKNQK